MLDEPFFMIKKVIEGKNLTGNDRFVGFCVDLTKRIAELVNFTYELREVKDKKYGAKGYKLICINLENFLSPTTRYSNIDSNGDWDGMVGELVRHEADVAIGSLTISSQRERAIAFSMPFMNIGISIMIKKSTKKEVS